MIMLLDLQQFMIFYFTTNIEKKINGGETFFAPTIFATTIFVQCMTFI